MSQHSRSDDNQNNVEKTQEEYLLDMLQFIHSYYTNQNRMRGSGVGNSVFQLNRVNGQPNVYRLGYAPIGEVGPEVDLDPFPDVDEDEEMNESSKKNSNNNNK